MAATHDSFALSDFGLLSGEVLPDVRLAYKTHGEPNRDGGNVILLPIFYTGSHMRPGHNQDEPGKLSNCLRNQGQHTSRKRILPEFD